MKHTLLALVLLLFPWDQTVIVIYQQPEVIGPNQAAQTLFYQRYYESAQPAYPANQDCYGC